MLSRLLTDHDHLRKSLNLLEMQFLELCRGGTPNHSIMLSIVVYIQEYPEQAHHPLEDAAYSMLVNRGGEQAAMARALISDHTELETITQELRASLEALAAADASEREKLKRQLSIFLSRQRQHLYAEEMKIYPLMNSVIGEQGWKKIASMVPAMDDPVFGERTQSEYERLYHEIESGGVAGQGSRSDGSADLKDGQ
jgi:hemerythrin-like domain-containing protein